MQTHERCILLYFHTPHILSSEKVKVFGNVRTACGLISHSSRLDFWDSRESEMAQKERKILGVFLLLFFR
jgi:hypothetical protein